MSEETGNEHKQARWKSAVQAAGKCAVSVGPWLWRHASVGLSVLVLVGVFLLGRQFAGGEAGELPGRKLHQGHEHGEQTDKGAKEEQQVWTCSMHPTVRQPERGLCPICNMELVPVEAGSGVDPGPWGIGLTPAAVALADIQTSIVRRKPVRVEVRMVGRFTYDETRVRQIAAWVPGRIEKLYADSTGKHVNRGDPLVEIYSPALYVAQKELHIARDAARQSVDAGGKSGMEDALLEATREKLRLWGLTRKQVGLLEEAVEASEVLSIPAPIGGTIVHKQVQEGMYVKEGASLLTVADLSSLWATLDLYETDMVWLGAGQKVQLTTEAYPGWMLEGVVTFIDPVVNQLTRTVGVRVEVDNKAGLLKPDMFVRATAYVEVADVSSLTQPTAGVTWTCPMHPEIREPKSGACPICGMDLMPQEPVREAQAQAPLIVPVSAVLRTGKRAVVYVSLPGFDTPAFEGRTIRLGPRAGDEYIVLSGLSEGDQVVTNGNFKIDSALQIQARPSMMSTPSETDPNAVLPAADAGPGHDHHH